MNNLDVIGIGAMNLDQIYVVDKIVLDGEQSIEKQAAYPGGSAANTIYGLARLGLKTGFTGAVGSDKAGLMLIRDFKKAGIDTSRIITMHRTVTGTAVCLTDKSGKRSIYILPGANSKLGLSDIDMEYIHKADYIFLSSFAGEQQLKIQKHIVSSTGKDQKVIFSPGSLYAARGLAGLRDILKRTELLFINKEEIQSLTGVDFVNGAKTCQRAGCKIVVVTLGKGLTIGKERFSCYVLHKDSEYRIKALGKAPLKYAETTGAGDAFASGFVFGLLNHKDFEQCGLLGNILANLVMHTTGARKGFPNYNQLAAAYKSISGESI